MQCSVLIIFFFHISSFYGFYIIWYYCHQFKIVLVPIFPFVLKVSTSVFNFYFSIFFKNIVTKIFLNDLTSKELNHLYEIQNLFNKTKQKQKEN